MKTPEDVQAIIDGLKLSIDANATDPDVKEALLYDLIGSIAINLAVIAKALSTPKA